MAAAMSARGRSPRNRVLWDARLARFEAVIRRHAEVGFGCVIDLDAFNTVCRNDPVVGRIGTAYQVAFIGIIGATARYLRQKGIADKIDFVFDEGPEFGRARALLVTLLGAESGLAQYCVGGPRSGTDERILPLQAAEWLVWQLRFHFAGTDLGRGIAPDGDKLFITPADKGATVQAGRLPIMVEVTSVNVVEFGCRLRWPWIMRLRWKSGLARPRSGAA